MILQVLDWPSLVSYFSFRIISFTFFSPPPSRSTHSTGDVDVETGGDEHRGGEGQQEEQGEVVHNETEEVKMFYHEIC